MGGLAIFIGFLLSTVLFCDITKQMQGILIGAVIIVAAVVVLLWCSVVGWAIVKETQHINGWQTTDIVVEMP